MKLLVALLAATASIFSAAATPIFINATISKDGKEVFNEPAIAVEGGGHTVIHVGKTDFMMSPALDESGRAVVKLIVTQRDGERVKTVSNPTIFILLGKTAKVEVLNFVLSIKVAAAK